MNKNISKAIVISFLFFSISLKPVFAVPPPDFIFEVASQFGIFFSIAIAFLSTFYAGISAVISRVIFKGKPIPKFFFIIGIIFLVAIAGSVAYFYDQIQIKKKQDELYSEWEQSSQNTEEFIETDDCVLLTEYYFELIQSNNFESAYEFTNKSNTLDDFISVHSDVLYWELDNVQKDDQNNCKASVTKTYEGHYDICEIELIWELSADGKTLLTKESTKILETNELTVQQSSSISNQEFAAVLVNIADIYILDAREDEEYEIGNMSGSNHIRSADIYNGDWAKTPAKKPIYVFCWSGVRGKQVSDFLALKGRNSRYLENGAKGWFDYGGTWNGGILLSDKYSEEYYTYLLTLSELKQKEDDILIIDARETDRFNSWHIPGSYSVDLQVTPSNELATIYDNIPKNKEIVTICDLYVNCFYAKIVGIQMEKLGYTFLGRYNKPWEYRNNL